MTDKADKIFTIENGEPKKTYSSFSFDDEAFGTKLEGALQSLIEKAAENVIPGSQISPGSDNPPRFMVINREMPVRRWSLDVLLIDEYATPTLLEAKLFDNYESTRKVVGQILHYAANAKSSWSGETLREKAKSYWGKKDEDINDKIKELLGKEDVDFDEFWNKAKKNLESNNIRLIVAMEKFRPTARKIIEFLNKEMENVEILGLEIRCYGESDDYMIVFPLILGQTQATSEKRTTTKKYLSYDDLRNKYKKIDDDLFRERMLDLLEWSEKAGVRKSLTSTKLSINGEIEGRRIIDIHPNDGRMDIYVNNKDFPDDERRSNWIKRLMDISVFQFDKSILEEYKQCKRTSGTLKDMDEEDYQEFKDILEEFCGT